MFESLHEFPNPFDFRRPVTDPNLLAGRSQEIQEIKQHLDRAVQGQPVHIALIGDRAAGKTSLLNRLRQLVSEHKLLPVGLDLDESTTETPFTFFKALFEAVIQAFVDSEILRRDDPRYEAWVRQVHGADDSVTAAQQLLLFGMVAASVLRGATHQDVSPSLLKADCDTLAKLAEEAGFAGIVLLIDEGDLIGERPSLIEKLRNLFQNTQRWMLVAAGTRRMFATLTDVFSPIPRQFARLSVGPFDSLDQVAECVMNPISALDAELARQLEPPFDVVRDIYELTGGRPYEIQLVCYHIWEALRGGFQETFELSTEVLDGMVAELMELGRPFSLAEIELIRKVFGTDAIETAVELIPYERMSMEEIALVRLLPSDYQDDDFERELRYVRSGLEDLASLGLVDIHGERFELRGDAFARIYFKYLARLHTSVHGHEQQIRFDQSYSSLVVNSFRNDLRETLLGVSAPELIISSRRITREYVAQRVGGWLRDFQSAADARDVSAMMRKGARLVPVSVMLPSMPDPATTSDIGRVRSEGALFFGAVFDVGLDRVENGELWINAYGWSTHELGLRVDQWIADVGPRLRKYRINVSETFTSSIDGSTMHEFFSLAAVHRVMVSSMRRFDAGEIQEAIQELDELVQVAESVYRTQAPSGVAVSAGDLADLHNRKGFFAASTRDVGTALPAFERAVELKSPTEGWLFEYNLAFATALKRDFVRAAEICQQSLRNFRQARWRRDRILMLLYLATPDDVSLSDPKWNTADTVPDKGTLDALISLHVRVYSLLAGTFSAQEFGDMAAAYEPAADPAISRVLGWTSLTVLHDPEGARRHFAAALETGNNTAIVEQDLLHLDRVTNAARPADNVESGVMREG